MRLNFLVILIGVLIISTSLSAIETGKHPSKGVGNETFQSNKSKTHMKNLNNIHHYNTIFDDYSSGGMPYEPYKK